MAAAHRLLRDRQRREDEWLKIIRRERPVTCTLRCPVDREALEAFANSEEGAAVVLHADGTSYERTGAVLANDFLSHVITAGGTSFIDIDYRFSPRGQAAVDAGFVAHSREYAVGADPFKLPKRLRGLALARYGLDFDDAAAFPHAGASLLRCGAARARQFLAHREAILRDIAAHFFGPALPAKQGRERAKRLFNILDMDGDFSTWAKEYEADLVPGNTLRNIDIRVDGGLRFDLRTYVFEQPSRTEEVARRLPGLVRFFDAFNRAAGEGGKEAARTAKSYVFQEMEGYAREAKQQWAATHGCVAINLQHDGAVLRLSRRWPRARALASLTRHVSARLGYHQPLSVEEWPADAPTLELIEPVVVAPVAQTVLPVCSEPSLRADRPTRPGKVKGARLSLLAAAADDAVDAEEARLVWGDARGHVRGDQFTVDRICDRRDSAAGPQYRVRWQGWGEEEDEWLPRDKICALLVAAYDAAHPDLSPRAQQQEAVQPAAAAALRQGAAAALGESRPRTAPPLRLPGTDQLAVDGMSRREVHSYARKEEPADRSWRVTRSGGHHAAAKGRGAVWLEWARQAYSFDADGWLQGDLGDARVPKAALFWAACEAPVRDRLQRNAAAAAKAAMAKGGLPGAATGPVKGAPIAAECEFVFDRLLQLEADLPVTHFCASDGSRINGQKGEDPRVGRVVLAHDGSEMCVRGGALLHCKDGHERHSFEAELAGFHDHLASVQDSFSVIVTDCLSGSMAAGSWRHRTHADKTTRYRAEELDTISQLEDRQRGVVYLWVHSHVGITPNEAADAECDAMRDGELAGIDQLPSSFRHVRLYGPKRSPGRAAFEFFEAKLLLHLMGASTHTILPSNVTWALFADARVERLVREADIDVISDARENRCGLLGDRVVDESARGGECLDCDEPLSVGEADRRRAYRPKRGTWEWFRQGADCPCCGRPFDARLAHVSQAFGSGGAKQTRWHVLTACVPRDEEVNQDRAKALDWLAREAYTFRTADATCALMALSGQGAELAPAQAQMALSFMLGLPQKPPVESHRLAAGYGKVFLFHIANMLRAGAKARLRLEQGRHMQGLRLEHLPRSVWMGRRGLREVWANREMSVRCFRALREWSLRSTNGYWRSDDSIEAAMLWWQRKRAWRWWLLGMGWVHDLESPAEGRLRPGVAVVLLRVASDRPAEVRKRRLAAAAVQVAAVLERKRLRAAARADKARAMAQALLDRQHARVERLLELGRRSFAGCLQKLVREAERATQAAAKGLRDATTRRVIDRIALRHELAVAAAADGPSEMGQRSFAGCMQALVRNAENVERATATCAVIARIRRRHKGAPEAASGSRQTASARREEQQQERGRRSGRGLFQALVRDADAATRTAERGARQRATDAVLARLRVRHDVRQQGVFAGILDRVVGAVEDAAREARSRRTARRQRDGAARRAAAAARGRSGVTARDAARRNAGAAFQAGLTAAEAEGGEPPQGTRAALAKRGREVEGGIEHARQALDLAEGRGPKMRRCAAGGARALV